MLKNYLTGKRGLIKLFQIILGILVLLLICFKGFGGDVYCINEPRLFYTSTLNCFFVLSSLVFALVALFDVQISKTERIYNITGALLFSVNFVLLLWLHITELYGGTRTFTVLILTGIQIILFLVDFKLIKTDDGVPTEIVWRMMGERQRK